MTYTGAQQDTSPSRPISPALARLRAQLRRAQLLRWRLMLGGRLTIGENVYIGGGAILKPPRRLHIANNVGIARYWHVETDVEIGDDVLISSRVAFIGNDHLFDNPDTTVFFQGRAAPNVIRLEGDNLVGFGATIISPARIGRGTIVGAGSLVVGDLPPYVICHGIPARPRRSRFGPSSRSSAT